MIKKNMKDLILTSSNLQVCLSNLYKTHDEKIIPMYHAVISRSGKWSSILQSNMSQQLVHQFSHSNLCASVSSDSGTLTNPEILWTSPVKQDTLQNKKLYLQTGAFAVPPVDAKTLAGISVVVSAFRKFPTDEEKKSLELISQLAPACRISIFRIGRVYMNEDKDTDIDSDFYFNRNRILDTAYSYMSQFLPVRFREISSIHLAQSIRLNYDTCEGMLSNFVCMYCIRSRIQPGFT